MRVKLSSRYGAVGLLALAALSTTHWIRSFGPTNLAATRYLLGVLPNVAAAIAIPLIVIAIWADHKPALTAGVARTRFGLVALASCTGLVGWEFVQQGSRRLVFDPHDIGATLVGTLIAFAAFWLVTPAQASHGVEP